MGFPEGSVRKESTCNAGDSSSILGLGGFPGEENGNHTSIPDWKIPWTGEPGTLQSKGWQRVRHN